MITLEGILLRWSTADEFYRERDDRTAREVSGLAHYADREIEIHLDPESANLWTSQALTLIACNLMARWARRVRVFGPEVALVPALVRDGARTLADRVMTEMCAADPFGRFAWADTSEEVEAAPNPLRLYVGPWRANPAGPTGADFLVFASTWHALGQRGSEIPYDVADTASISAVGLAAALGVADVFKRAIGHPREEWVPSFAWCTWSQRLDLDPQAPHPEAVPPVPESTDLRSTLLAGAGAIGSALVYLLDLKPLTGTLGVLDMDCVEVSNLNRSPLFDVSHVVLNSRKTEAVKSFLQARQVLVETLDGTWAELAGSVVGRFDTWISLTNEHGAWTQVPFYMPPTVAHATTTSGWGFAAGRHEPGDDCTLCRMPRRVAEFRGRCAEGAIDESAETPARASLPFLSVAAAALLSAEIVKANTPGCERPPNDTSADLRYGLPAVIKMVRRATPSCRGCNATSLRERNGRAG